jgi:hypothetical protein
MGNFFCTIHSHSKYFSIFALLAFVLILYIGNVFLLVNYSQTRVHKVALQMLRAPVLSIGLKQQLEKSLNWAVYTLLQMCDTETDIKSLLSCKTEV